MRVRMSGLLTGVVAVVLLAAPAMAIQVGERPRFAVRSMDGQVISNETMAGRIVIMDFWATWCPPCVASKPHLRQLNEKYKSRGVVMVSLSRDRDARTARRFAESNGMDWLQVHDMGQTPQLAPAWGVRGIPHAFILSPDGELLWRGHPMRLEPEIERALSEHPPRVGGNRAAAVTASPEALQAIQATRDAVIAEDFALMASKLKEVPDEAFGDRRVLAQARVVTLRVRNAPGAAEAIEVLRGADPEFAAKWDTMAGALAPRAADAGSALLGGDASAGPTVSPQLAATRLRQAEQFRERGDHLRAWRGYQWLVERAAHLPEGQTAAERITAYEADADAMAAIRNGELEDEARSLLAMARNYEQAGNADDARAYYQRVIDEFPSTESASTARKQLDAMR
jgi:thiol-disulfide isomerase/thioredoxin